jgi:hypothetical protein
LLCSAEKWNFENLYPFVATYDLAMRTAMSKKDHWQALRLPFHPVEPDIFAVVALVSDYFKSRNEESVDLLGAFPMASHTRVILESALRLRDADADGLLYL